MRVIMKVLLISQELMDQMDAAQTSQSQMMETDTWQALGTHTLK